MDVTNTSYGTLNTQIRLLQRARKEERKLYYCTRIEQVIINTENIVEPLKLEMLLEKKTLMHSLHELKMLMGSVEN